MKLPQHIFALSKNEQRVVILILLALLALAVANHYRRPKSRVAAPAATKYSATPVATPASEEESRADD